MNVQEAYIMLQEDCGIRVGDTVRVLRAAIDFEMGWENVWDESMDDKVGNIYEVIDVNSAGCGIQLDIGGCGWYYPFFILEKIEGVKVLEITMQDVEDRFGCKVKIIEGEDDETYSI